jgi:hypothetical protein
MPNLPMQWTRRVRRVCIPKIICAAPVMRTLCEKSRTMTLDEARTFLRDDNASWVRWCEASAELCHSSESSFEDWLLCLSRRGLPAETGACKLYVVTKRQRANDSIDSFVLDAENWREYLRSEKFIA